MEMLLYTLRRIGISIMTLLLVAAITFFLMNAIPPMRISGTARKSVFP